MNSLRIDNNKKLRKFFSDEEYRERIDVVMMQGNLLNNYIKNMDKYGNIFEYENESHAKIDTIDKINFKCYCGLFNSYECSNSMLCIINPCACQNIKHIKNSSHIDTLELNNCQNIKDVGNLRKLKRLKINNNVKIYGIHLLKNLDVLELKSDCYDNMRMEISKLKKINDKLKIILMDKNKVQVSPDYRNYMRY